MTKLPVVMCDICKDVPAVICYCDDGVYIFRCKECRDKLNGWVI